MKVSTIAVAAVAALAVANAMPQDFKTADASVDNYLEYVDTEFESYEELLEAFEEHGNESTEFFYQRALEIQSEDGLQAGGTRGVDYSTAISQGTHSCFRNNGQSFVIPRGYRSYGVVDPNLAGNVNAARSAGIKYVDTYAFPQPTGGASGAAQFNQLKAYIDSHRLNVGMVWFDVEGTQYWRNGQQGNRNFFNSWMSAARASGWKIGIYSSKYQWESIFGTGFNAGSSYPIWYAHYDRNASFSDWVPFGGWSRPAIKQYIGDVYLCGAGVDHNIY